MGVGDFIRHQDAAQLRPPTSEATSPRKSRQLLAEQARVEVPATKLIAPIPLGINGRALQDYRGDAPPSDLPRGPYDDAGQRDMFDTDVEGVDDSTVAGTSVIDVDEFRSQVPETKLPAPEFKPQVPSYPSSQQNHTDTRPIYQQQHERRAYESNWYEGLGDKAIKSAGFESDDADTDGSQLTSVVGDDERGDSDHMETENWYSLQKHGAVDEPLSRRLESFWAASRRAHSSNTNLVRSGSKPSGLDSSAPESRKIGSMIPVSGGRKITLPRSMTATPRNRFSPPKPSLLEQLELSPTRRSSGPRPQPGRKVTTSSSPRDDDDDAGILTRDFGRRGSGQSGSAFDLTNMDVVDDDDTIHDPFFKRPPTRIGINESSRPKKRQLEADYPTEILHQKSFSDLQAEPFDRTPTPAPTSALSNQLQDSEDPPDKVSALLRLPEQERRSYLSNLSIEEWEDCGDQLIDKFTTILSKMKELRHARRKTAAAFEAEIKRRHENVEEQTSELSQKLNEMREGGIGVLRGRTP